MWNKHSLNDSSYQDYFYGSDSTVVSLLAVFKIEFYAWLCLFKGVSTVFLRPGLKRQVLMETSVKLSFLICIGTFYVLKRVASLQQRDTGQASKEP